MEPNTSFSGIYYQRYHIECATSCLTLNSKVKCQGHNIVIYFVEFTDINNLVRIDTTITFLSHCHQEILNNVLGPRMISARFVGGGGVQPLWCLSTPKFVLTPEKSKK